MLKSEIIETILSSPRLILAIQDRLEIYQSEYMRRLIKQNDPRLTQLDIIKLICAYLEMQPEDILEPETEPINIKL